MKILSPAQIFSVIGVPILYGLTWKDTVDPGLNDPFPVTPGLVKEYIEENLIQGDLHERRPNDPKEKACPAEAEQATREEAACVEEHNY